MAIETWLHIGKSLDKTKKTIVGFRQVLNDELQEQEHWYYLKNKSFSTGGLYSVEVERTDDKIIISPSTFKFKEEWHDREYVEQLRAERAIFDEQERTKRFEKRYMQGFEMPQQTNAIAAIYAKLKYHTDRRSFENLIIDEIRKRAKSFGD